MPVAAAMLGLVADRLRLSCLAVIGERDPRLLWSRHTVAPERQPGLPPSADPVLEAVPRTTEAPMSAPAIARKRAALYLRVSTEEQWLENQRPELERLCEMRGLAVASVHEEQASATKARPRARLGFVAGWTQRGASVGRSYAGTRILQIDGKVQVWRCGSLPFAGRAVRVGERGGWGWVGGLRSSRPRPWCGATPRPRRKGRHVSQHPGGAMGRSDALQSGTRARAARPGPTALIGLLALLFAGPAAAQTFYSGSSTSSRSSRPDRRGLREQE